MKKYIVIIVIVYLLPIYAQTSDSTSHILINAQKDYLYNLIQLNTETMLEFNKSETGGLHLLPLINKKLNINAQIKNTATSQFYILEKCHCEPILYNNIHTTVLFILLDTTDGLIKKSGFEDIHQKGPSVSHRWRLEGNILVFIITHNGYMNHPFQKYIY